MILGATILHQSPAPAALKGQRQVLNAVFPFPFLHMILWFLNNIPEAFPRAPRPEGERGASFLAYFSQVGCGDERLLDRGWKSRFPVVFPSVLGLG